VERVRSTSSAETNFADEVTWITWKTKQDLEIWPFLNSLLEKWVWESCPKTDPATGVKGGPEPLEKEIHEILGSKCEDRVSEPTWLKLVQNTTLVQKLGLKVDPHVSNLKSRWFRFRGVEVHPFTPAAGLIFGPLSQTHHSPFWKWVQARDFKFCFTWYPNDITLCLRSGLIYPRIRKLDRKNFHSLFCEKKPLKSDSWIQIHEMKLTLSTALKFRPKFFWKWKLFRPKTATP